jgi:hypothetical protein
MCTSISKIPIIFGEKEKVLEIKIPEERVLKRIK